MLARDPAELALPPTDQEILALRPRLLAFLRKLAGAQDAEDLCQDCLFRALRSRHSFDANKGSLQNWMMKTAFRTFLDHKHRLGRQPSGLGAGDVRVRAPREGSAAEREELQHLLARLSDTERVVLIRFHQARESIAEIGAALGMPEGTVKSHLHRARRRLAQVQEP